MAWHGTLDLRYAVQTHGGTPRCIVRDRHDGPLRVLSALYPEGAQVCHSVIVHPPGGIAGGDRLDMTVGVEPGAHALLTTPGATRFYRSAGDTASQTLSATVAPGARLEWLPLETLVYSGALAESRAVFTLAPGGEMIGRDLIALGLPAADQAFERGHFLQQLEIPGVWLERGRLAAGDALLMDSPAGLAGHRVLATQWFAAGQGLEAPRQQALLDAAREAAAAFDDAQVLAGCTAPHEPLVVLRVLAHRVEPAMALLNEVWSRWRTLAWGLPGDWPRVWRT